ncbi:MULTISPECIES: DNA phosphorothioation-associated DGQHR protein 1 [Mesorhizobium]|uniref:DNA phosphorothioation-associated DGQHR protein 1 n=1 Tax=Mesorhizobium TaxID=68287 RepID=UPI001596A292|nr:MULTISPECIES: DNA phosphorothioation-associated DGQHR protein 1 [Mesorhizobium]
MIEYPFTAPALPVDQPIGTFYVTVLPAELLLQVASSDVMSAALSSDGVGYVLSGTQRLVQDKRLVQIADYIDRIDSAFPNSIILAANYNREVGLDLDELEAMEEEEREETDEAAPVGDLSKAWTVTEKPDGCLQITIPSAEKLAAIIDGQHRLFAFAKADAASRLDMQLICAVFIDLPKAIQAQIFATINSTQKPVDRSLTYELFGYNVSDEPEDFWTPDKLAVFLTRKLATQSSSPLIGKIAVSPKRDEALVALGQQAAWKVSTAVVVDGILRLVSSNPKRDTNAMRTSRAQPRSVLARGPKDKAPLRSEFIGVNDALIYAMVENYLKACANLFWQAPAPGSFIVKTVGVQALFDILRRIAPEAYEAEDLRVPFFENRLRPAAAINFADERFRVPSGSGRSIIRRALEMALGL